MRAVDKWFPLQLRLDWGEDDIRGQILGIQRLGVEVLLEELIVDVLDSDIAGGVAESLTKKLDGALDVLQAPNAERRGDAVSKLRAFVRAVEAQRGKKISTALADELIAGAEEAILTILGG